MRASDVAVLKDTGKKTDCVPAGCFQGREAARSVPDALEIEACLKSFAQAARSYDACCSGKICVSELRKM